MKRSTFYITGATGLLCGLGLLLAPPAAAAVVEGPGGTRIAVDRERTSRQSPAETTIALTSPDGTIAGVTVVEDGSTRTQTPATWSASGLGWVVAEAMTSDGGVVYVWQYHSQAGGGYEGGNDQFATDTAAGGIPPWWSHETNGTLPDGSGADLDLERGGNLVPWPEVAIDWERPDGTAVHARESRQSTAHLGRVAEVRVDPRDPDIRVILEDGGYLVADPGGLRYVTPGGEELRASASTNGASLRWRDDHSSTEVSAKSRTYDPSGDPVTRAIPVVEIWHFDPDTGRRLGLQVLPEPETDVTPGRGADVRIEPDRVWVTPDGWDSGVLVRPVEGRVRMWDDAEGQWGTVDLLSGQAEVSEEEGTHRSVDSRGVRSFEPDREITASAQRVFVQDDEVGTTLRVDADGEVWLRAPEGQWVVIDPGSAYRPVDGGGAARPVAEVADDLADGVRDVRRDLP